MSGPKERAAAKVIVDITIVMTKARNKRVGYDLEITGGVFREEAIVIQGIAIDKLSPIALGVPQSVIDRAPRIIFAQ